MRRALRFGLAVLASAAVGWASAAPCAQTTNGQGPAPVNGSTAIAPANGGESAGYVLGAGDHVRVTVYGEPDLSGEFQVGPDGTVALPLVGTVPAAGKTSADFQTSLVAAYKHGILVAPRVSVELLTFRPFFILGEVQKPGAYPYTSDLTVFNAVATAGGFTYRANQKWVYVRHADNPSEIKIPLTSSTPLAPGDTAIIKQRYF